MSNSEYNDLKHKALKQLKSGKSLFGKDGAFAPLLKQFLQESLDAEMDNHLNHQQRNLGNKRNGKKTKTIKSNAGSFEIQTPQDRYSSFEPQIIKKRQTVLANSLEQKIIGLYGLGMSYRDISKHIKEMYDTDISHTILSQITDRIIPEIKQWQNRPLDKVYPIIWLDAMHFKVKDQSNVRHKALYNIMGITVSGHKEILGLYISETEGSNFWLQILTDLQNRGLADILIACIDNLKGFSQAIQSIFPKTQIQHCIIHQIRNSLKYISSKESKLFMNDLKTVYKANTKDLSEENLLLLSEKWGKKYPLVIKSWEDNWDTLSTYFEFSAEIRKLIYTTNAIEGYHRQIRKITKTKSSFTSDMSLLKLVYLGTKNIMKSL